MQYTLVKEIGRGGFGIVHEVTGEDGNKYAYKILNPAAFQQQDHAMLVRRFEREVRYQQMVDHPNVVPVIEHNLTANPPWFVMPLAAGSLKDDLEADRILGGTPKETAIRHSCGAGGASPTGSSASRLETCKCAEIHSAKRLGPL